jgi:predicted Zn-dependent protease
MPLERSATLETLTGGPPPAERAVAEAHRIARELTALKKAPVVEDYTGPILFEGRAAAQAVYELLSDSLSGTPPPKGGESLESPLARKLGKRILPKQLTVVDDPTLTEHGGVPLIGHYAVDDEGVAPERTVLVEAGRLRTLLMSRAPRQDITRSNGHGRSGLVGWARGRAGNLIVSAQGGLSKQALRARLLRAVREEGGRYGLVVTELEARAAASSGQAMPQPELMYRLTLDGKEELVRGATISPISVRDLKDIVAAGRESHVYGVAGPSPGGFAVLSSFVSPSLLFEEVEVKRPTRPFKRPPLLPHPHFAARAQ